MSFVIYQLIALVIYRLTAADQARHGGAAATRRVAGQCLSICLTPVRDPHDDHDQPLVLDGVQDAVVAAADSPHVLGSAELGPG